MSLFQFGFTRSVSVTSSSHRQESSNVPSYLPQQDETSLNNEEYRKVSSVLTELSNPTTVKKKTRGKYTVYTDEDCARIGRYASINGNERVMKKFLSEYLT